MPWISSLSLPSIYRQKGCSLSDGTVCTPHESKDVGRKWRMSSKGRQAGGKRHARSLLTTREIWALSHCPRQKPSRSTQIAVNKRGSGDSPKATSQTRGLVRSTKRRARLLAKIYEVNPFTCPKCGSEMKVIAIIQETEEIRRILAHLVKIAGGRPAFAARLRSHFAQLNEHHDAVASFRASTMPRASGTSAPSALFERETGRVEYTRRRIRRPGDRPDFRSVPRSRENTSRTLSCPISPSRPRSLFLPVVALHPSRPPSIRPCISGGPSPALVKLCHVGKPEHEVPALLLRWARGKRHRAR